MKSKTYIGVDVGGTKILAGLLTRSGKILARKKTATPQKAKSTEVYHSIKTTILELLQEHKFSIKDIAGIGLGIPGVIKPDQKTILITPNIDLTRFPLVAKLKRDFKTYIYLGNDVNLGLLGECWKGSAKRVNNVIGLFLGTGIGGGLVINKKLYLGSQGAAAEIGHMIMNYLSPKERAGIYGSLEALASRTSLTKEILNAVQTGEQTFLLATTKNGQKLIKSKQLSEALKKKDPLCMKIIDQACEVLGKACISLRHVFNPDMIIFGGGVVEACGWYMLPRIEQISQADPFFKGIDSCLIKPSSLADDAVILGAVALVKENNISNEKIKETSLIYRRPSNIVYLNGKKVHQNCIIQTDGKTKCYRKKTFFKDVMEGKCIKNEALRKLCKKKPEILIFGSIDPKASISKEGLAYLKEKRIKNVTLPIEQAISLYNSSSQEKVIILYQKSS